jgi:hypothetical protein
MQKCSLEVYNNDTATLNAMYITGSRCYLNRWVPFGDTLPIPTQSGVMFNPTKQKERCLMYSPWNVGLSHTRATSMVIKVPNKLQATSNSVSFSYGMCFYREPWWDELESMFYGITFTYKVGNGLSGKLYSLGYNVLQSINIHPGSSFIHIMLTTVGKTAIWSIQGLDKVGTVLSNEDITLALLPPKDHYYILWGQHDKERMERSLYSNWGVSSDRIPPDVAAPIEKYIFKYNPTEASVPMAYLRSTGTPLYPVPSLALIEDATIQLFFPICDRQQVNILTYLLNYTTAPFIFTDYLGHKYQVALSSLLHETSASVANMSSVTFLMQLLQIH